MRFRPYYTRAACALGVLIVAWTVSIAAYASPASAAQCTGGGDVTNDGGSVVGTCDTTRPPAPSGPGSGPTPIGTTKPVSEEQQRAAWEDVCGSRGAWQPGATTWLELDHVFTPEENEMYVTEGVPMALYYRHCVSGGVELGARMDSAGNGPGGPGYETLPVGAGGAAPPPVDPLALRDTARARIQPKAPAFAMSPTGDPSVPAIVNLATWVWLEPGYWATETEEEQQGFVAVRVEAAPIAVRWVMGDGEVKDCDGPGVAWRKGLRAGEGLGECTHLYRHASSISPDRKFHGTVSVTWGYRWWLNGAEQGAFGTSQTAPVPFDVVVAEIQAIHD